MREYLDLEFQFLKSKLTFAYDLENIIDDFVLMCFFVGNDFLPSLPNLDIAQGALNTLITIYKNLLPIFGGYLTTGANINFQRFDMLMKTLAQYEKSSFGMQEIDAIENLFSNNLQQQQQEDDSNTISKDNLKIQQKLERDLERIGISFSKEENENKYDDDDQYKDEYYIEKFKVPNLIL